MKKTVALILCLIMLFALAACGQTAAPAASSAPAVQTNTETDTAKTVESAGDVVIGVSIPLTGPLAEAGEQTVKAMDLFCEQINAAGGVNGRTVRYEVLDDKMDPTEASMVAQRFLENKDIICVVGSLTSGTTLAVLPIYADAGMGVICPTGNSPELGGYSNFIRIVMDANLEAPMVGACAVNNLGAKKVGIIFDNSDYGTTMVSSSTEIILKNGGEIVAQEAFAAGTDKDFSVQLTKMKQAEADTVILVADYRECVNYFSGKHNIQFYEFGTLVFSKFIV